MHQTDRVQLAKNVKTPTKWQKLTKHLLTTDTNCYKNIAGSNACAHCVIKLNKTAPFYIKGAVFIVVLKKNSVCVKHFVSSLTVSEQFCESMVL